MDKSDISDKVEYVIAAISEFISLSQTVSGDGYARQILRRHAYAELQRRH